jgi:polyphosphate kinase
MTHAMHTSIGRESHADKPKELAGVAALPTPTPPETSSPPPTLTLESPELYINRELSLLEFQKRVLEQAQDSENPLLQRIKFLSIVSSNLDEFFMVRVSGLQKAGGEWRSRSER